MEREEPESLEHRIAALEATVAHQREWLETLTRDLGWLTDRVTRAEVALANQALVSAVSMSGATTGPLVSVIMPTRDRAALLERAVRSVRAQSYRDWELLVVDDGSRDDTAAVLEGLARDDRRVRPVVSPTPGSGAARARNVALDEVAGAVIAYLDDDNEMHPEWLRTVMWVLSERPDVHALYGGILVDDPRGLHGGDAHDGLPFLWLEPYSDARLCERNLADMSAIAHRRELTGVRFDEGIRILLDWDLMSRLAAVTKPLAVPAAAVLYRTDAADRLSERPSYAAELEAVRHMVAARLRAAGRVA